MLLVIQDDILQFPVLDGRNVVSAAAISAPNLGQINVSQEDSEDWFLLHTVGKKKKESPLRSGQRSQTKMNIFLNKELIWRETNLILIIT